MKSKAFTLVEIIIVIAVISVLTAIIIPNYHWSERKFALQRSASQVAQDIREAEEKAMSVQELSTGVPPGYGVYFKNDPTGDILYIYADTNPSSGGDEMYTAADEIVREIKLEKKISIQTIYRDSTVVDSISVNFKPPDPSVKIFGGGTEGDIAIIVLSLDSDPSEIKTIKINKAGLVIVE